MWPQINTKVNRHWSHARLDRNETLLSMHNSLFDGSGFSKQVFVIGIVTDLMTFQNLKYISWICWLPLGAIWIDSEPLEIFTHMCFQVCSYCFFVWHGCDIAFLIWNGSHCLIRLWFLRLGMDFIDFADVFDSVGMDFIDFTVHVQLICFPIDIVLNY